MIDPLPHGDGRFPYCSDRNPRACSESFSAMEQNGLTTINTFTLGPVWVQDGAAADIRDTITA